MSALLKSALFLAITASAHFTYMTCPSNKDCDGNNELCCQCSGTTNGIKQEPVFLCVHNNVTQLPDTTAGNPNLDEKYVGWKVDCEVNLA